MSATWLFAVILVLAVAGFFIGRARAMHDADGDIRKLHSLPIYYGLNVAMAAAVPALVVLLVWQLAQPLVIESMVSKQVPDSVVEKVGALNLVMSDVHRIAEGLDRAVSQGAMTSEFADTIRTEETDIRARLAEVGVPLAADVDPAVLDAAQSFRGIAATGRMLMSVVVLGLAIGGFGVAYWLTGRDFRARKYVEGGLKILLIMAAGIAILTTVGIVLSLVFESRSFFSQYPWYKFFFGTTWSPNFRGDSDLGILPLLWGTAYVSLIALVVAVPVGLFAAIYLSEYAGPRVRAVAKPLIEILAGIPTIVYGLFALTTVGPLLRDYFAQPMGLGNSANSVATAGLVMGIMLIPFVSSLSDDIINAVPQSLRDGSLGLGATSSETIRQVVIPAALPGIIGAILLAASRAIGETMIVVLGAGAAARMDMNPFEAMTTVTVKIVSQLTGDTDFSSPETLVAFALGLTLFVVTLGLNVLALIIVRKYREQYE
ncbi:phosphate ABC transporter permease subunit PstC [Chachezhania sediminis]|uniref:phosphate ABC transporter permease subunit PstC n=1 Tax=Chachezhania sediminis TaxID=2599291 RepID=UPI00131D82F2|nr:phosphate ABC transporter permease subunit PstC [Chachezhania sediminis]